MSRLAGRVQEAAEEIGAGMSVAVRRGDAAYFEFRAGQRECQGECIVDVVADVGIDQDGDCADASDAPSRQIVTTRMRNTE